MFNLVLGSSFYKATSETRQTQPSEARCENYYNGTNPCLGQPFLALAPSKRFLFCLEKKKRSGNFLQSISQKRGMLMFCWEQQYLITSKIRSAGAFRLRLDEFKNRFA